MARWLGVWGLVAGCAPLSPRALEIAKRDGDVGAGEEGYRVDCAGCHGEDGRGTPRATHRGEPVNLTTAVHWYSEERVLTMIVDGVDGTDMEAWGGRLDDQAIADLYAFLLTFEPEP